MSNSYGNYNYYRVSVLALFASGGVSSSSSRLSSCGSFFIVKMTPIAVLLVTAMTTQNIIELKHNICIINSIYNAMNNGCCITDMSRAVLAQAAYRRAFLQSDSWWRRQLWRLPRTDRTEGLWATGQEHNITVDTHHNMLYPNIII